MYSVMIRRSAATGIRFAIARAYLPGFTISATVRDVPSLGLEEEAIAALDRTLGG
jgi:hypothetical protein